MNYLTNMQALESFYLDSPHLDTLLKSFRGKKVGISGVSGFLGKNWANFFTILNNRFDAKICIYGFDISEGSTWTSDPLYKFIKKDFTESLNFETKFDYFIHAASFASPMKYRQEPLATLHANVSGFENCIEESKKGNIDRLILLSTSEIYGNPTPEHIPTIETYNGNVSCTGPRACYDESKRFAETLLWVNCNYYSLNAVAIRPFNVFGPGQSLSDGRIVPDLMRSLVNKEKFIMHSDGKPKRTFCFISDFIIGSLLTSVQGISGEAYNIGNDNPEISIKDLVLLLKSIEEFDFEFRESTDKNYLVDNPLRRCPDISKVHNLTGWRPVVDLRRGLQITLDSYVAGY